MSVRITTNMTTRQILADVQNASARLSKTQAKMASGKELNQPSDNPFQVSRALQLRADMDQNRQYQRNVGEANSWHDVTDSSLGHISDFVLRARELILQGANDTMGADGRSAVAAGLQQIVDSVKGEANAQYAGRFIFSGSATNQPPYQLGASDAYSGNNDVVKREIGPNVQIDLNVTGNSVIGDSAGGLLKTLRDAITDLNSGNTANLQTTRLQELDAEHDTLVNARAVVGARSNRLDTADARLKELEETQTSLLSETEDADMGKTYMDFSVQSSVYQAALKAGAQVVQPSLIDFLR